MKTFQNISNPKREWWLVPGPFLFHIKFHKERLALKTELKLDFWCIFQNMKFWQFLLNILLISKHFYEVCYELLGTLLFIVKGFFAVGH